MTAHVATLGVAHVSGELLSTSLRATVPSGHALGEVGLASPQGAGAARVGESSHVQHAVGRAVVVTHVREGGLLVELLGVLVLKLVL